MLTCVADERDEPARVYTGGPSRASCYSRAKSWRFLMRIGRYLALSVSCLIALSTMGPSTARAEEEKAKLIDCEMKFNLKGWSAIYKTSKGEGTITCDNGQAAKVTIKAKGGGITFGKSEIVGGTGKFSEVRSIDELFGSYA